MRLKFKRMNSVHNLLCRLLFGFASMVGNFLCPPGEAEKNIVEATTPRFWAVMRHLKSTEVLERLSDFIE